MFGLVDLWVLWRFWFGDCCGFYGFGVNLCGGLGGLVGFWFAGLVVLRVFGFAGYVVLVRLALSVGFGCAGVASS